MNFLSDNLLTLVLTLVLGLSPVQNIAASASECMDMNSRIHHQMKSSDSMTHINMTQADSDCCKDNTCGSTHCINATVAAITSNNISDVNYIVKNISQSTNVSLTSFYPSSLYRPPKF